jgi:hypothetical protein
VTSLLRRFAIALASFVIAGLCVALVGGFIPQLLGAATNLVVTILLGYAIFRDILRRERGAPVPASSSSTPS